MNKFFALAVTGFVALSASNAMALTQTQSASFGQSQTDLFNTLITVPGFNATLGTLNSATISIGGSAIENGTIKNTGANTANFTVTSSVVLTISGPGTTPSLNVTFAPVATVNGLTAGSTANYGPITGANTSGTIAGAPLSAFIGGPVTFTANSTTTNSSSGGGGNAVISVTTTVGGVVTVVYDYTAPVTTVPEPASMALLGMGLAGLGLIRRRRA